MTRKRFDHLKLVEPPAPAASPVEKAALLESEPAPGVRSIDEPDEDLDQAERQVWAETIAAAGGRLTAENRHTLRTLCVAVVEHREAMKWIREKGRLVMSKTGDPYLNPYLKRLDKANAAISKAQNELLLTPASKARAKIKEQAAAKSKNGFSGLKRL